MFKSVVHDVVAQKVVYDVLALIRYVLAWRVSNTQDTAFCLEALEEAFLHGYRKSSIVIRAVSLPVRRSRHGSKRQGSRSAWMGEDESLTIFLLNGCGVRSSMNVCI